jgi:DNA-binding NarL/FixJ family response regulator
MTARERILIVDDEDKIAFFLRESLESLDQNLEIQSATSIEEAMQQVEQQAFDLLVTDLRLPGANGVDLIKQVKARHPDTKFILITAFGWDEMLDQVPTLGIYHYFLKPFHVEDFNRMVLSALRGPEEPPREEDFSALSEEVLHRRLGNLQRETEAQCVLAVAADGTVIGQEGEVPDLDSEQFLGLAMDSFVASRALARHLSDDYGDYGDNLIYHQGDRCDVYMASVHANLFLVLLFDRRVRASRVSIVWLYARRVVQNLRRLVRADYADYREDDTPRHGPPPLPSRASARTGE